MRTITPHLWFDTQAKEAATFYTEIFPDSRITHSTTLNDTPSGNADIVSFELAGHPFMAISAGPYFQHSPAISFMVNCDSQSEIDTYWAKLSAVPEAEQCGWLKDQFGVSWQIVPTRMQEMMSDGKPEQIERVTKAFLKMKKFNLEELEKAYATA